MTPSVALEQERFSLDDPEAERKLLRNLDARKVRLTFDDFCRIFACVRPEGKLRLMAFLSGLQERRSLVQVMPGLYCRPDLADGHRSASRLPKKRQGRQGVKNPELLEREVAALLAFIRTQPLPIRAGTIVKHGVSLRIRRSRVKYLLCILRAQGALLPSAPRGSYVLGPKAQLPEEEQDRKA